jgi:hypothetical protein
MEALVYDFLTPSFYFGIHPNSKYKTRRFGSRLWSTVLRLKSDQSDFMALVCFNLWGVPGFIFESCGCFLIFL